MRAWSMARARLITMSAPLGVDASPALLTLEHEDGKTVYALAHPDALCALELGAWVDLPEDNHLDLSGGALVRVRF